MAVEFTSEQKRVIDSRGRNLLVCASAGSGKTAVLVQRIIKMILGEDDKENAIDIDRLLVVTFTEAAAKEMRERIGKAIDEKLRECSLKLDEADFENKALLLRKISNLEKQSALLYKAQISTIHSFCLNVIRNNFNLIGLDPAFRVADETELKLMRRDVIDEIFEKHYEVKDEKFLSMVEYFTTKTEDDALKDYIFKIFDYSEGQPWVEEYLEQCIKAYEISSIEDIQNSEWMKYLLSYSKAVIKEAYSLNQRAKELVTSINGPIHYLPAFESDEVFINKLLEAEDYFSIYQLVNNPNYARLSTKKEECDLDIAQKVKDIRDEYKGFLTGKSRSDTLASLFREHPDDLFDMMKSIAPMVRGLIELTMEFSAKYRERRQEKGIISFSDMEHYALDILYTKNENGEHVPSDAAMEYRTLFDEIFMDEYQDCNLVQEKLITAISREDDGRYNRFMVGDVKQSIYKFRLSDPEIFMEKSNCYQTYDPAGQSNISREKIDLHKNFRSRKSVINTVNDLFGQIMHEDFGGVEYDDKAKLEAGADYYPEIVFSESDQDTVFENNSSSEIFLMDIDSDSDLSKSIQEANLIALRIKELVGRYPVYDSNLKTMRAAKYSDIVILLRSMTDVANGLKEVLGREGIPSAMNLSTGFYNTNEIQTLLQLLKVIDNPRQDIPMYGVLHSSFGKMSDEELADLKAGHLAKEEKSLSIYDLLLLEEENNDKIKKFLEFLDEARKKAVYTPIHSLIEDIVSESGYLEYVSASAGGVQKRANVRMLISKAASFEATSYKGLFHFLRYIQELRKVEEDDGEADVSDENADVVRIMTIHKSKGLEFPICFVSGIHKQFNYSDSVGPLVIDMKFGLGASYVDLDKRISVDPLIKKVISLKIKQDMLGEEIRVLYVALTRAKEKMIITGVIKNREDFETKVEQAKSTIEKSKRLSVNALGKCKNYMDFMIGSFNKYEVFDQNILDDILIRQNLSKIKSGIEILSPENLERNINNKLYEELNERMLRSYAFSGLIGMSPKTSVSELKHAYMDETVEELFKNNEKVKNYVPTFINSEKKMSGTDRGSAYHKIMELLDFDDKNIKSQINKFRDAGLISEEWAKAVPIKKIEGFLESNIGRRAAKAQKEGLLFKEQPFVLGIEANRVKEEYPKGEILLLQGIIDAYFIEENEIVLFDYKTDVVNNCKELIDRYRVQLDYYEEALERILEMKVKESLLYSFYLGEEVNKNSI